MVKALQTFSRKILQSLVKTFSQLSLRWKIYFSLGAILVPVSLLVMVVQTTITKPLLEEEVRMLGLSLLRSLASDIKASRLLQKPRALEDQLIEISWLQPNIIRLDVMALEGTMIRLVSTNVSGDASLDFPNLILQEIPRSMLHEETAPHFWEITYPLRDRQNRLTGYMRLQISLNLVEQVVSTFSKVAVFGTILSTGLLILLLSYYLRRTIENERRLRMAENTNVALTAQLVTMQQELHIKDKLALMGQLTASFAHEIGTPLNSLSGHVQLLREEIPNNSSDNRLNIITSQIARIEGIVKDFLHSTYAPPQQKQLVELEGLLLRMKQFIAPRLHQLGVQCDVLVPAPLDPIRIVPSDLEQVLLNLANNALDSIESKQWGRPRPAEAPLLKFSVEVIQQDGRPTIQLTVTDTGEGIAPEALKRVTKPFFTTKAPGRGTGLGLTICQRLIKKNGGRLEIQSELGKGTRILVTMPYGNA